MAGELLPLFPLQVVLLPRTPLALHIFEDRYKEMIGELLTRDGEFGVVLGRGDGIVNVGCTARVDRVLKRYDDGRLDILCVGERRFKIVDIDQHRSFARAYTEPVEDDDMRTAERELAWRALAAWKSFRDATSEEADEPDAEDDELSFALGALSNDLEFRQSLLVSRSETQRLEIVAAHFVERLERWQREQEMKRKAHTNGYSKHWKG